MCGINGVIYRNELRDIEEKLSFMNSKIFHRGPDDSGVHVYANKIGLAMQRLSIIDLTSGHQPLYNTDRSLAIVFNGELYNFKDLRLQLERSGIVFRTSSDTEVVLQMYARFGPACLQQMNGMFAFAIHDVKKQIVFIARDRFGEKPLYYFHDESCVGFASELKSLTEIIAFEKRISLKALQLYLQLTYIPAPYTIYERVYKLEPGHYMAVSTETLQLTHQKYWDIDTHSTEHITDYTKAKKQLRDLVFDSVEKRMIADVPLGVFLSGGVDSTIIAAIMSQISGTKINSFSIGFTNKQYDESKRAMAVATHIGSNHHQYVLDYDDILKELDAVILNYDEPFADSSCLPTFYVSKKAAKHVKVALTGDGGDEVFGGYNKYLLTMYRNRYNRLVPKMLHRKLIAPFLAHIGAAKDSRSKAAQIRKFILSVGSDVATDHLSVISLGFQYDSLEKLAKNFAIDKRVLHQYLPEEPVKDDLKLVRYLDKNISLEGDMLAKVDRASMLCSLECRAPYLDHRLMEFSYRMPDHFLLKRNNKKRILKDSFEDILPPGFMRTPKLGFEVPVGDWFKKKLKNDLVETLKPKNLQRHDLFDEVYIQSLVNEHISSKKDNSFQLWTLYCFQKWYDRNFL